jgi:hypothetical protein
LTYFDYEKSNFLKSNPAKSFVILGEKMEKYPPLFQFRKIDNFLFQTLINRTLWFSSPKVFNDPFDCQLPILTDNNLEEIEKFLIVENDQKKFYSDSLSVSKRAKELFDNKSELKILLRQIIFTKRKFSCFVENEKLVFGNSTMWGNYADKSKGVCLKFEFDNPIKNSFCLEENFKILPLRIDYRKDIPYFNYIRYRLYKNQDINSSSRYFMGIKSADWEDESEVRLVFAKLKGEFENDFEGAKFYPGCLKEIILGCNATMEDKEIFENIVKCNPEYSHIKVQSLKKSDKWFEFEPQ